MPVVAIQGIRGGCGASTLASGLTEALARLEQPVLLVDLNPANLAGLYLGLAPEEPRGWAHNALQGKPWHEAAFVGHAGCRFLPFGRTDSRQSLANLPPGFLRQSLAQLDWPENGWIVLDVPSGEHAAVALAEKAADAWLQLTETDPACHVLLHAEPVTHEGRPQRHLLVNRFEPHRLLSRDLLHLWGQTLPDLLPCLIHEDEAVREAQACQQSLWRYAPQSQASQDLLTLATWCLARWGTRR